MAKILLKNTREHAIHLNVGRDTVLVPSSRQNPDDRSKIIPGQIAVESDFIDKAKKSPVVQHYFREGWLQIPQTSKAPAPTPADTGKPATT